MKVSIITLATVFVLSGTVAMAQSGGAANAKFRSSMNSMHTTQQHRADEWSSSRYNGHGLNPLGVTTNQGRRSNGG